MWQIYKLTDTFMLIAYSTFDFWSFLFVAYTTLNKLFAVFLYIILQYSSSVNGNYSTATYIRLLVKLYLWSISKISSDTCCDIVDVQDEWPASWASGDGADEVLLGAVSLWLWDWWLRTFHYWWRPSIHHCQVQTCWTSIVYSAVVSLF